jgi:RNA polymerase sigma-70 factor (family 1)
MTARKEWIAEIVANISLRDDTQSFRRLFDYFYSRLITFARYCTRSDFMAEEVVSEVFVSIWENRSKLADVQNIRYYLYSAVKNRSLNQLKKSGRLPTVPVDELAEDAFSDNQSPEKQYLLSELQADIQAAIARLPPRCRLIYSMIREEGLSYKEAAEILDISPCRGTSIPPGSPNKRPTPAYPEQPHA